MSCHEAPATGACIPQKQPQGCCPKDGMGKMYILNKLRICYPAVSACLVVYATWLQLMLQRTASTKQLHDLTNTSLGEALTDPFQSCLHMHMVDAGEGVLMCEQTGFT